MIESCYWKDDLLQHSRRLKPVKHPPRWSEKLVVNFEKELIISFFCIRKLFETHKVSNESREYRAKVFFCAPSGEKITRLNASLIDEVYDLNIEKPVSKGMIFLANQMIHSCTMFAFREADRNWGGVYACSDYERNKKIYRIPIQELINMLELVGNDYQQGYTMTWDEKKNDYVIKYK